MGEEGKHRQEDQSEGELDGVDPIRDQDPVHARPERSPAERRRKAAIRQREQDMRADSDDSIDNDI